MRYLILISTIVAGLIVACSKDIAPLSSVQKSSADKLKAKTHTFDADNPSTFRGKYAVLAFPAGCFLDAEGKQVSGKVKVTLREAFNTSDFVKAGLNTASDDKLLASNGMFQLVATQKGKELKVNPDVGIYAAFYTPEKDKNMNLFVGDSANGTVNWKVTADKEMPFGYDEKKCDRCEKLVKLVKRNRPKVLKAQDDDPWRAMRYYWKNGTLMYFGSGVVDTIASLKRLKECDAMLRNCSNGAQLLKEIEELKAEIAKREKVDAARMKFHFYEYKLNQMGWHNFDKFPEAEMVAFKGTITDEDGDPIVGPAVVHLVGTDARIHLQEKTENGSFSFKYMKGKKYKLLVFAGPNLAATSTAEAKEGKRSLKVMQKTEQEIEQLIEEM